MIEALWRAVRQSSRALARDRGFALTVIVVLALGIGTSTGILSLARAVLAQSLPYPHGERLVQLFEANHSQGMAEVSTSYPNFLDWRSQAESFEALAVSYDQLNVVLGAGEESATAKASVVTPDFFEITGPRPVVGRLFDAEDHRRPGGHAVAIVSEELWDRRLESDPGAVGQTVDINERPYTVIGVLPAGFTNYPNVAEQTDLWLPMMMGPDLIHPRILEQRTNRSLPVIGRLKAGVSMVEARAEMETISERLGLEYPDSNSDWVGAMKSVREAYLGSYRGPLMALLAGSAFLLLVGCANIANLQLVRARDRRSELALRVALGASRRRLFAETLVESLMLTTIGAAVGVVTAAWLTPMLAASMPVQLPGFVDLRMDELALGTAVVASVLVGVLFGCVPLIGLGRGELRQTLTGTGRGAVGAGGDRLRRGLVVVEVAAAVLLLLGAGLFVRSTTELLRTDLGFDANELLTVRVRVPLESRTSGEMAVLATDLERAAAELPGARDAILWAPDVPGVAYWYTRVRQADRPDLRDDELTGTRFHYVGPGALGKLGLRLSSGRDFEPIDGPEGELVVVVSESLARSLWPGEEPLDKIMRRWNRERWARVVGVVEDAYLTGRRGSDALTSRDVYFAYAQEPQADLAVLVRTDGTTTGSMLREVVQQRGPDLPVFDVQTTRQRLAFEEATPKVTAALAGSTAVLALLLAAIGLYSVIAHGVSRKRREIGLRMALGAWPTAVLRGVVAQGLGLAFRGVVAGLVIAYALTRLLSSLLYEVSPTDPTTFAIVPAIVLAVVAFACLVPARRATRIHPMSALRGE